MFVNVFQKKLEKFEGIPTANEFEELMKFDDMDADGKNWLYKSKMKRKIIIGQLHVLDIK